MVNYMDSFVLVQRIFAVEHYPVSNLKPFSYLHIAIQIGDPQ